MVAGQHESDPDDDAKHEADNKTKPGGVPDRTLTQVKNPRRLVFVHAMNLHLCPVRTTDGTKKFSAGLVPIRSSIATLYS